jgi:hypothetical protein
MIRYLNNDHETRSRNFADLSDNFNKEAKNDFE